MPEKIPKNNGFLIFLMIIIGLSVFASWYRYIATKDFNYFISEQELPDQFDLKTYNL